MTAQELFDAVVRHMQTSHFQTHRGAVGSLIPDNIYHLGLDDLTIDALLGPSAFFDDQYMPEAYNSRAYELPAFFMEHKALLNTLQWLEMVASHWSHEDVMRAALIWTANKHSLEVAVLDEGRIIPEVPGHRAHPTDLEMAANGYWSTPFP